MLKNSRWLYYAGFRGALCMPAQCLQFFSTANAVCAYTMALQKTALLCGSSSFEWGVPCPPLSQKMALSCVFQRGCVRGCARGENRKMALFRGFQRGVPCATPPTKLSYIQAGGNNSMCYFYIIFP